MACGLSHPSVHRTCLRAYPDGPSASFKMVHRPSSVLIMAIANSKDEQSNSTKDVYHHEWGNDVVRRPDGTLHPPIEMDNVYCVLLMFIVCWIGAEINLTFTGILFHHKQLRKKSCYVIQFNANFFSNMSIFATDSVALFLFSSRGYEDFCDLYPPLASWCHSSFLLNVLISLFEFFIQLALPRWHRNNLNRWIVLFSCIELNLALALFINWQFIGGWSPLRCALQVDHVALGRKVVIVLYSLCLFFCALDSFLIWKIFHPTPTQTADDVDTKEPTALPALPAAINNSTVSPPDPPPIAVIIDPLVAVVGGGGGGGAGGGGDQQEEERNDSLSTTASMTTGTGASLQLQQQQRLAQLEGAKWFLISVIPIFIFSLAYLLLVLLLQVNNNQSSSSSSDFTWLLFYLIPMMMNMHSIIHPTINVFCNEDFTSLPEPVRNEHDFPFY